MGFLFRLLFVVLLGRVLLALYRGLTRRAVWRDEPRRPAPDRAPNAGSRRPASPVGPVVEAEFEDLPDGEGKK